MLVVQQGNSCGGAGDGEVYATLISIAGNNRPAGRTLLTYGLYCAARHIGTGRPARTGEQMLQGGNRDGFVGWQIAIDQSLDGSGIGGRAIRSVCSPPRRALLTCWWGFGGGGSRGLVPSCIGARGTACVLIRSPTLLCYQFALHIASRRIGAAGQHSL